MTATGLELLGSTFVATYLAILGCIVLVELVILRSSLEAVALAVGLLFFGAVSGAIALLTIASARALRS